MRTASLLSSALLLLCACNSPKEAANGKERGPCYGNNSCDDGLSCYSDLCVNAPDLSAQRDNQTEITELRAKLEKAEFMIESLKRSLVYEEEGSQPSHDDRDLGIPSIKDPFAITTTKPKPNPKTKRTMHQEGRDVLNPFEESETRDKAPNDPCIERPNLPECMLD